MSGEAAGKIRCLVTGGSGFVGKHLVRQLVQSKRYDVTVFDINTISIDGATMVVGDLRNAAEVSEACKGMDVVFHVATASLDGNNQTKRDIMHSVNVVGTQNVVDACVAQRVRKLIYTSSASVVFQGQDLVNVNESYPLATRPMDFYTATKIDGEKIVLAANGRNGCTTCALRPSGIFGDGDAVMVPTLVRNARNGKLKYIIGSGKNLFEYTYVGNVAQAHIDAVAALDRPGVAGKAFFITNDDPQTFFGLLGDIVEGLGYRRPYIRLPWLLVFCIVMIVEFVIWLLRPIKQISTDFTLMRITIAASTRTFDITAAKTMLGYKPTISIKEGIARTVAAFSHLRADAPPNAAPKKKA